MKSTTGFTVGQSGFPPQLGVSSKKNSNQPRFYLQLCQ